MSGPIGLRIQRNGGWVSVEMDYADQKRVRFSVFGQSTSLAAADARELGEMLLELTRPRAKK